MTNASSSASLFRLMQLVSPALPVGGFAYSQGLESAVELGVVNTQPHAHEWIEGVLTHNVARIDLPIAALAHRACVAEDIDRIERINVHALALRETRELHAESQQMARSLLRLLSDMGEVIPPTLDPFATDWAVAFAVASTRWNVNESDCLQGLVWTWLENQVAAAIKLVPLGQTQGQIMLFEISAELDELIQTARQMTLKDTGASTPMLAHMSALHETQYSRLFRS
ncbi:MAG: urease accessory protein UreF [Pseudomonadota bacterium]